MPLVKGIPTEKEMAIYNVKKIITAAHIKKLTGVVQCSFSNNLELCYRNRNINLPDISETVNRVMFTASAVVFLPFIL